MPLTAHSFETQNAVDQLFYGRIPIEKAAVFLNFSKEGIVKNLLHYLKYGNQQEIGTFLGNWFGEVLADTIPSNIDAVIPVPLHRRRLKKRRYNQVTPFGERLAHHLNADFREDILSRTKNTKSQTKKSRSARAKLEESAFAISKESQQIQGKHLLLVDDVITTGATIEACAKALLTIPEVTIYVAAIAWVPPKGI
ncbi:MAG: phosphoribosyltransferase family protein [Bacteroidota bacterium]